MSNLIARQMAKSAIQNFQSSSDKPMVRLETEIRTTSFVKRLLRQGIEDSVPLELVREASEDVAKEWKRLAKKNASAGTGRFTLSSRSGGLVRSIRYRSKNTAKGKKIDLEYHWIGQVHENGAIITPKRAPYLVFFIPGIGWRKSRRVVIPSRPWASKALTDARKQFPEFVAKRLNEQAKRGSNIVKL